MIIKQQKISDYINKKLSGYDRGNPIERYRQKLKLADILDVLEGIGISMKTGVFERYKLDVAHLEEDRILANICFSFDEAVAFSQEGKKKVSLMSLLQHLQIAYNSYNKETIQEEKQD